MAEIQTFVALAAVGEQIEESDFARGTNRARFLLWADHDLTCSARFLGFGVMRFLGFRVVPFLSYCITTLFRSSRGRD